ncbi:MAG: CPBP family intramembrane glutamic endopeptidase [Gemmatimonadaceae bacterium]
MPPLQLDRGTAREAIASAVRAPRARQRYWGASRAHRYSLLFALPLLVAYEALAALLSGPAGGMRNGADALLRDAFIAVAGSRGPLLFAACLAGAGIWLVGRDMRANGRHLRASVFAGMAAESLALALLFGIVVGTVTAQLLGGFATLALAGPAAMGWWARLMVPLGAGLYEELFFRVLLVSALAYGARKLFGWRALPAGAFAAIVGAFIFSAFHYIGPYGDRLELQSFMFRWIAGLAFSALYLARGFGITAWTHALYDVFLLLALGR